MNLLSRSDWDRMSFTPSANRPLYSPFFSVMGATSAIVFRYVLSSLLFPDFILNFSGMGAAYGTAKSGVGIAAMAILKPERIMKSVIPIIMAGIVAIYGVVVAVLISGRIKGDELTIADVSSSFFEVTQNLTNNKDFTNLGAGLAVGLSGLSAGMAIGIVGDAGVRGTAQQPKLYVGMILILIFAEVLGLYGLITALVMMYT